MRRSLPGGGQSRPEEETHVWESDRGRWLAKGAEPEKGCGRERRRKGRRDVPPLEAQATSCGSFVWRFPTSGVVMWSPLRKASEYTRFLASVPSLGHLIVETVSSLARGHPWLRA
jgi:hypothetical protein